MSVEPSRHRKVKSMTGHASRPHDNHSDEEVRVLGSIDDVKRERNIPLDQKMTAMELIEKHQAAIHIIHQAGRPQSDVYLYLESQEGKLEHADDTLRKAINKVVKNWRNRVAPTPPAVPTVKPALFADTFNTGGQRW